MYKDAYEKDMEKYKTEREEYLQTHPSAKAKSDKPKKPLSSYILFSNELRDKVKGENPGIFFSFYVKQ